MVPRRRRRRRRSLLRRSLVPARHTNRRRAGDCHAPGRPPPAPASVLHSPPPSAHRRHCKKPSPFALASHRRRRAVKAGFRPLRRSRQLSSLLLRLQLQASGGRRRDDARQALRSPSPPCGRPGGRERDARNGGGSETRAMAGGAAARRPPPAPALPSPLRMRAAQRGLSRGGKGRLSKEESSSAPFRKDKVRRKVRFRVPVATQHSALRCGPRHSPLRARRLARLRLPPKAMTSGSLGTRSSCERCKAGAPSVSGGKPRRRRYHTSTRLQAGPEAWHSHRTSSPSLPQAPRPPSGCAPGGQRADRDERLGIGASAVAAWEEPARNSPPTPPRTPQRKPQAPARSRAPTGLQ